MPDPRSSHLVSGLVLATSLLATYGLWKVTEHSARQKLQTEFDYHTEEVISHIVQRMTAYQEVLYGVRALFNSSDEVTRDDFHTYVKALRLEQNYSGIQALSHAPIIAHAELSQHIEEMRAQGFADYTVTPPGVRDMYTPVIYLEPFTGRNLKALGYDTFSEPVRRSAMLAASDNDRPAMTGKLTLVQESDEDIQAGFLLFMPLYRNGLPHETVQDRRTNLAGWVTAVFRMDDLMAGLGHMQSAELGLTIYDGETLDDETRMFNSGLTTDPATAHLRSIRNIPIADRSWTAVIESTPAFAARLDRQTPLMAAAAGVVFSLLLTLLVYGFMRARGISAELAESEERWRYALEGAGDGVWDWDIPNDKVKYTSRWREMLGYSEDDIGTSFSECYAHTHPDDVETVRADIQAHLDGKTPSFVNEHRMRYRDGSWRWILDRGMVTSRARDGRPLRMIGTHTDITARKQSEHELQDQRDFNNAVVEAAGNVIVVLDMAGRIVYFNHAAEELTGFRREEVIGQPIWDWVIPEEQQAAVRQVFENLKAGNKELAARHENDWVRRDGSRCTLDWHNTILRDDQGRTTHVVALGYNIMERKQAEEKIQRLSRLYSTLSHCDQAIVHSASEDQLFAQICRDAVEHGGFQLAWIGLADSMTRKVRSVAAYGDCTEYIDKMRITVDADDARGRGPTGTAIRENRPVWCQDCRNDPSTEPWHEHCVEFDLRSSAALPLCVNGEAIGAFTLHSSLAAAFDEEAQELLQQMASDISHALDSFSREEQRKQAEDELSRLNASLETIVRERTDELRRAKELADAASKAKSDFLSNMSHEIRTPLTAIIGFSEALLSNTFDTAEHNKLIATIVRNGKHLQNIINDILDLSKIEANHLESKLVDTSLFMILGEIQSLLGPGARDKGLDFKINYHFPLPSRILTEPVYLKQILINLCSNAGKFTSEGHVHIDVSCDNPCRTIRIDVSDSGIGMTPEEVENIFDPFIQADSTTTRQYGGTGLGLAISSRLAAALDGKLSCVSEKGKGSTFTLEIANRKGDMIDLVSTMEEANAQSYALQEQPDIRPLSGHILLVEDSLDNQQLINMYVRKTGADIDLAGDGRQAVDMALKKNYDLILMDMQMPVMDGLEAIELLRKKGYVGPIASLTANAMLTNRNRCMAAGANDYLVKPIDLKLFYDTLNRYLRAAGTTADEGSRTVAANNRKPDDYYSSPGYLKVVERFRQNLPGMVAEISRAVHRQDWEEVQAKSHDLKGIGGAMGYPQITEVAGRINLQVKNRDYNQAARSSTELEDLHRNILQKDNPDSLVH